MVYSTEELKIRHLMKRVRLLEKVIRLMAQSESNSEIRTQYLALLDEK